MKKFDVILSRHFRLSEFCVTSQDFDNFKISYPIFLNITKLVNVLEVCRQYIEKPITITSGYRPELLNDLVGGADNSYHLVGSAVDMVFPDTDTYDKVWDYLSQCYSGYNLYYPTIAELLGSRSKRFIHLALNCNQRADKRLINKNYYE